jgi:hypothetical protein
MLDAESDDFAVVTLRVWCVAVRPGIWPLSSFGDADDCLVTAAIPKSTTIPGQ